MSDDGPPELLVAELDGDERLRWHGRPTWATQYLAIAAIAVVFGGISGVLIGFFLAVGLLEATALDPSFGTVIGGILASAVLCSAAGAWLVARYRRTLAYGATGRRILYCRGALGPSCRSVPWTEVSRVEYRERPGTGDDVTFPGVPKAARFRRGEGLTFRGLANARRAARRLREIRAEAVSEPDQPTLEAVERASLPEPVAERLSDTESLVYSTAPRARYETMTGTPLIVASVSLAGLLAGGAGVASAVVWGVVPLVPLAALAVVAGAGTWYLLRWYERRHYESGLVVVTDRQVIRYDGTDRRVETLTWRDAEGVITDDGHPKVLEEAEPVRSQHGQHYRGLTVPATDDDGAVYRRLRGLYERNGT